MVIVPAATSVLLLLAAACAPTASQKAARAKRATESQPYDFEKEGTIPPVDERTEEPDVVETPVTDSDLEVEEAEAPPDTVQPEAAKPVAAMVDGFRVQVFASSGADVAEGARRLAEARLGVPAYVEMVDGLYKVRVGDCRTREEAETLLARCRAGDYKDAWIVECPVRAPSE